MQQLDPVAQAAFSRLDALATKLGVAAGQLFEVVVRQAGVEAWSRVGIILLALLFWIPAALLIKKGVEDNDFEGVSVVVGLGTVIFTIVAAIRAFQIPTLFLNPQYWAIKEIGKLLTGSN